MAIQIILHACYYIFLLALQNQKKIDQVVIDSYTISHKMTQRSFVNSAQKQWVKIAYNNYIANLKVITIYGNRKKAHILIIFGQFDANDNIW
jgi:hypothetical protein